MGTISAQKKNAKIPQKAFWIKSATTHNLTVGGVWDIPGRPKTLKNGMNLAVWELGNSSKDIDRMYTLVPVSKDYYRIIVGKVAKGENISNRYGVDILGNKLEKGSNVGIWKSHGKSNQQFKFFHLGNGAFKIYTKNGKVLSLANGSSKNGSSIQIWPDANRNSKIWYLIDPVTKKTFIPKLTTPKLPTPKYPTFFKDNKDVTFIYRSAGSEYLYKGTAKITDITGNTTTLSTTSTGISPYDGKEETVTNVIKIEYINGIYYTGPKSHRYVGKFYNDGKQLTLSNDGGYTFSLP